jgi:hypothetical protein
MFLDTLKDFIDLGGTVIVSLAALYILWQTQKNKKSNGTDKEILKEIQLMNQNHLEHIKDCIQENNDELVNTIHSDNVKIIELLSRIDGRLSK